MEVSVELSDKDARDASALLGHSSWSNYYRPRLEAAFKKHLNNLAQKRTDGDDIIWGWIGALNWALTFPQMDIDEYNSAVEEQKAQEEEPEDTVARRGFHSPYVEGAEKEH